MMKLRLSIGIILVIILAFGFSKQADIVEAEKETFECVPVPGGLVYWLRAENNADDFTGDHNGTLYGDTSYTTGMVGNAFTFDGEEDYVLIPSSEDLPHGSDARTVEMWIYSESDSWLHDYRPAFHTGQGSLHAAFGIDFDNHPKIQFYTWVDDLYISTDLPEVGWFHVAMVYDGSTLLSAYINGTLSDSRTLSESLITANLDTFIGAGIEEHGYPRYFLGKLDEVSMYNRALSDTEILSIYNAGSSGKCVIYEKFFPLFLTN